MFNEVTSPIIREDTLPDDGKSITQTTASVNILVHEH